MTFKTKYGHFSEDGREYIITTPHTPTPWINVLSNGDYGLTLSQAGSGYSWRTHASLNRITRWEQDLVRDAWGKYLYIRDMDSREVWSLGYQPCSFMDRYEVRHGLGYSVITNLYGGVRGEVTYVVPKNVPCELWHVRLENERAERRHLRLFSYVAWNLGTAPDWHREFHKLFIETSYDEARHALFARKVLWDLPGTHWNRTWPYVAFHSASGTPAGAESDAESFLGRHGSLQAPKAVVEGRLTGTFGRFVDAIGSLAVDVGLPSHGEAHVTFTLGAADSHKSALELVERYRTQDAVEGALREIQAMWQELLSGFSVETPDLAVDPLVNVWLPYQAVAGRLWGRSAYYQTGGAYGFRDQLQDSLVWLLLGHPERTLEQLRLHAAHQFSQGHVLHWWHPLAEEGLESHYSDDLLWLPFVTLHCLHETGDLSCLQMEIPYLDGSSGSLLEHCLRAFDLVLARRSERGLPLILEGDWNDGLNAVGPQGRGESVWMAHFLFYNLTAWAKLDALEPSVRQRFEAEAAALKDAVNEHGWDGGWYWRATTDGGALIGSHQNEEGRIFLNAQTWAVLSGTAPETRAHHALGAAKAHLYKDYGPLLLAPEYTEPNETIGYLSRYAPGARENGGVYVHAACWAVLAERKLHGAEAAYALWRTFNPVVRGAEPEGYAAEPYVMPGNVNGPRSPVPGRAGWTWYTGSAGWYLRAFVEGVLGVEATLEGLRVGCELPRDWDEIQIIRTFRRAHYDVLMRRARPGEHAAITFNGERWESPVLPVAEAGSHARVEVTV